MKCPACGVDLLMTERQGVEVDYCPNCRGVWLDKGELDKIIEKSAALDRRAHGNEDDESYGQRKRGSWWSEIFD